MKYTGTAVPGTGWNVCDEGKIVCEIIEFCPGKVYSDPEEIVHKLISARAATRPTTRGRTSTDKRCRPLRAATSGAGGTRLRKVPCGRARSSLHSGLHSTGAAVRELCSST